MDTNALKKFAQAARNLLIDQVANKLAVVLDTGSIARREHPEAMKALEDAIASLGKAQIVEKVAYTWFNRFTALRFMDVNGYTNPRVVSPAGGATRPEILAEALAGNLPDGVPATIAPLLDGRTQSNDAQAEAYRLLLVHACNIWHGPMPFLFEQLDDYTELLMPEDLLSPSSILAQMRDAMTEDACKDVEIIGWLYQFYISEKKEKVFAGLKTNIKVTAENIPAATQLFTPHWIVRYLVENSLGRLWLLNRPQSKLEAQMDYFIAPEESETDFLRISRPEEIRICDPACGSGHMLTYAFDLLYAIYTEEGYEADNIPALILKNNLHGLEIDDRAGALAAFALVMKAAAKLGRRKFLRLGVQPNICVMQNVTFTAVELQDVAIVVGRDLFTADLRETLGQFEQAKNFGSLIVPKLRDPAEVARVVRLKDFGMDLLLRETQLRALKVLEMAEALSSKYQVVVANPPYMDIRGGNNCLKKYISDRWSDGKKNLYSAFYLRARKLGLEKAFLGFMTPISWMAGDSYGAFRETIVRNDTIINFVQPEFNAFYQSAHVAICAFVSTRFSSNNKVGTYISLAGFFGWKQQSDRLLDAIGDTNCTFRYSSDSASFLSIPGVPIAYALRGIDNFDHGRIDDHSKSGGRIKTHDNEKYLRWWWECNAQSNKWRAIQNGGDFRKYFGNCDQVVDWTPAAVAFYRSHGGLTDDSNFAAEGVCWSLVTSAISGFRLKEKGIWFSSGSPTLISADKRFDRALLAFLNSKVCMYFIRAISPTVNTTVGDIGSLPLRKELINDAVDETVDRLIAAHKSDWNSFETSREFELPFWITERNSTLKTIYNTEKERTNLLVTKCRSDEHLLNSAVINAYGLREVLTPEVPLEEITLTCNPAHRYSGKASAEELETRLRADTMAEFLHYAVGCMFGRYSLDSPGLILANQGEGLADYLARVPEPSFEVDADNVIPVLDGDWFADDVVSRFQKFLRITFGEANYQENLAFIEAALGKDVRKWFTKDFFEYHVRRYKKRPIYWMFSSPKGSFNALIYMHRYRPDTVSIVLNDYLREYISKLQAERVRLEKLADDQNASQAQRTKALKDVGTVIRQIDELEEWEREVVFPLAQAKIEIDLDDGVKRNYTKFGAALKPIKGLEAADE